MHRSASDVSRASLDFGDIDGDGRDEWLVSFVAGEQGTVELWQSQRGVWRNLLADHPLPAASQARLVDLNDDGQFEIAAVGPAGTMLLQQGAGRSLGRRAGGEANEIAAG